MTNSAPKTIVLFSDGTGNSSAKLFKTNVWRMYEAVDLGPPAPDRRPQISYYDDGVGTSAFKPLAVLGGVFGYGLKRNVLDIYKYACRNYKEGDDIYAFGFSRGAFTIRLAVALMAHQGLVQSNDEGELDRLAGSAYREFRRALAAAPAALADQAVPRGSATRSSGQDARAAPAYKRYNLRPAHPLRRRVGHRLGLRRSVRRADAGDRQLDLPAQHARLRAERAGRVRPARPRARRRARLVPSAALGRGARRDAWPGTVKARTDRLQQVWFTGMHSDVGGGYPDESLSYVSLLWMMEEAEESGSCARST